MVKVYIFISTIILSIFIQGCSGGGSSSGVAGSYTPAGYESGVFLDSPVEGLYYETASINGYTDAYGRFNYKKGETVTFKLGNLTLGSSVAGVVITPIDIVAGGTIDDVRVINIARLLQTFDDDGTVSSTIKLSLESRELNITGLTINFSDETFLQNVRSKVIGARELVSKASAVAHMAYSITDKDRDYIPNNVELAIGFNPTTPDQNNNREIDGFDSAYDPFFKYQWYIKSDGGVVMPNGFKSIIGNDLGVFELYNRYTGYNNGNPITIMVNDSGIDINHEDLKDNIDKSNSINFTPGAVDKNDPVPVANESHGTEVAGIIAARGFNGIGIRGIAPMASISGSNLLQEEEQESDNEEALTKDTHISSNSYGSSFEKNKYSAYLKYGVEHGRDSKGTIYVFAAGNSRDEYHDVNLDQSAANRYAIKVAALNHKDVFSSYSSPGAGILISGYGGEYGIKEPAIMTTNISGKSKVYYECNPDAQRCTFEEDTKLNYTYIMNGTSSATPTVSGALALVLEACPDLDWRDIRYLLAKTATQVDKDNSSWVKTGSDLHFSRDYGFGKINAKEMINQCQNNYVNLEAEVNTTKLIVVDKAIPFKDNGKLEAEITVDEDFTIESLTLSIKTPFEHGSGLAMKLTSPSGTDILMMQRNNANSDDKCNGECKEFIDEMNPFYKDGWDIVTPAFIDENSSGTWKLTIANEDERFKDDTGNLESFELKIYGHKD